MNRDHLKNSDLEYYMPDWVWTEGGKDLLNKDYTYQQAIELMDDLGQHKSSTLQNQIFDPFELTSSDFVVPQFDSQIINVIIPSAMTSVFPLVPGQIAELCVGKKKD